MYAAILLLCSFLFVFRFVLYILHVSFSLCHCKPCILMIDSIIIYVPERGLLSCFTVWFCNQEYRMKCESDSFLPTSDN
jgi:hypothetical protein